MAAKQRGLFLVFEGLDRSGKSTQSKRLAESLRSDGHSVRQINFPNRTTTIGGLINEYLQSKSELSDEAIHLLFSSNRWECSGPCIEQQLREGTHVVCDRYAFSGVAFTAAKGLDFEWCKSPDVGLPAPDKVFYLDIDPTVAKSRADFGEERYEKAEFQKKVGQQFAKFAKDPFWVRVDAARVMDDITDEIGRTVREMISGGWGEKAVDRLWTEKRENSAGAAEKTAAAATSVPVADSAVAAA
eukprot:gene457-292_t